MGRMMLGHLTLGDVADVEAFCNASLQQLLKRWRATLRPDDQEDALAFLVSETWRLSDRYDSARTPSFAAFARPYQSRFLIEFYRHRFVDRRYARRYTDAEWQRIEQLSNPDRLHAPLPNGDGLVIDLVPDDRDAYGLLELVVAAWRGDATTDCDPDLARLLDNRDSRAADDLARFRDWATRRAEERAARRRRAA
jgi:hypothetical protein